MIKKKTIIIILILVVTILPICVISASADSASISMPSTAYLGDTITVKVTFECTHGSNKIGTLNAELSISPENTVELVSITKPSDGDMAAAEYKAGKYVMSYVNDKSTSSKCVFTFKFKTKKAETVGMHVAAEITDTDTTRTVEEEDNSNIKVVDKSTLSGNANASIIYSTRGKLVPEFNPNVTSYNVNVDYSVDEFPLTITTQEDKAEIVVEGSKSLKVGNNTRTVIVTAPNGTEKKYVINIYRASSGEEVKDPEPPVTEPTANPYEMVVNGKTKFMVSDYSDVAVPEGFSPAMHTIGDTEVPVLKDVVSGRIIVWATDENGENGMYCLYNTEENSFSQFKYMSTDSFKCIVLDYNDTIPTLKNYFYTAVTVDNFSVGGFRYNDTAMADFVIFYAETMDGGKDFYRYDSKDKTIQRAVEFTAEYQNALKPVEASNDNIIERFIALELKSKIIVVSGALAIMLVIVLAIIVIVKATRKTPNEEALEAARDQEFMDGFGENNHLFLDDDYDDDTVLDDDFKLKGDDNK